jgi:hypothetical protein
MAEDREYEPPAIRRFMATRWGTAARMLFSVVLTAAGLATALRAQQHGSVVGTGWGAALTVGGAWATFKHAGVLTGRVTPAAPGSKLVSVATFADKDEAMAAAARLKLVGVRSVVSDDVITVRSSDAERARAFLGTPATQHRGQAPSRTT